MNDILAERVDLMERAEQAWTELRNREGSDNPFVRMVSWTLLGLDYTEEFGRRYQGMTVGEALKQYVGDLETAVQQYKNP